MNKTAKNIFERIVTAGIFCACMGLFFLGAQCLYEHNNSECQIRHALITDRGTVRRVLFSPDDNPQQTLLSLIQAEREKISIAAFSLTNSIVAQELVKAKMRGVAIEIIADGQNAISEYSKISFLKTNKIAIWIYPSQQINQHTPKKCIRTHENLMCNACQATELCSEDKTHPTFPVHGIMHNKFMIFKRSLLNKTILWTGSYNFTRSANNRNQENIIITDDSDIIKPYRDQFEKIKTRCLKLTIT